MTDQTLYRAFICHSAADRAAARRLHRQLERFPIDKDLVGQETAIGPAPASLRPIQCLAPEQDDNPVLSAPTNAAIDQSDVLIVIASPAAARSAQVNEQVRVFRHRHPERAVLAVVVGGKHEAGHHDLFPPALFHKLDADGTVTGEPVHVEVGDIRRDSPERARVPSEIAAFLTGLNAEELFDRARRFFRRRFLRWTAIGAVSVVLLAGSAYFGLQGYREYRFRGDVAALVTRHAPASAAHAAPGVQEFLTEGITSIRLRAATDPRHNRIINLLRGEQLIEANSMLNEWAYAQVVQPDIDRAAVAESFRNAATIAGLIETDRPRDALTNAVKLDPTHPGALFRHGWLAVSSERTEDALAAFRALLALPTQDKDRRDLVWARIQLGQIALAQGDLSAAAAMLAEARAGATRAAQSGDATRQRDLAIAHERSGDVQTAQRDFTAAEQSYRASQAILIRQADREKANLAWQRDIALSHGKLGDLLLARSNATGAVTAYEAGRKISQDMAATEPTDTDWPRDVARSHGRLAAAYEAMKNPIAALEAHRNGMAILEQLAAREPFAVRLATNAELHRELFGAFYQMAAFQLRVGNPAAARPLAARAVTLASDLITYFPHHPRRKADLDMAETLRNQVADALGNK